MAGRKALGSRAAKRPVGLALDASAAHGTTPGARDGRQGKAADCSILQCINADCGGLHLFTADYSTLHLECDPL